MTEQSNRRRVRSLRMRYGRDYFTRLGRKGGNSTQKKHRPDYRVLGALGGRTTLERYGSEHFRRLRACRVLTAEELVDLAYAGARARWPYQFPPSSQEEENVFLSSSSLLEDRSAV